MKVKSVFSVSGIILLIIFLLCAFNLKQPVEQGSSDVKTAPEFPEEIITIITNSCYDCHTSDSQNKMASFAMDFMKWNEYKNAKKAQLLLKIDAEVSEKNMPPKKYLDRFPDKALSDEQIELLSQWAKKESTTLEE